MAWLDLFFCAVSVSFLAHRWWVAEDRTLTGIRMGTSAVGLGLATYILALWFGVPATGGALAWSLGGWSLTATLVGTALVWSAESWTAALLTTSPRRPWAVAAVAALEFGTLGALGTGLGWWSFWGTGLFGLPLIAVALWATWCGTQSYLWTWLEERGAGRLFEAVVPLWLVAATPVVALVAWWTLFAWIDTPIFPPVSVGAMWLLAAVVATIFLTDRWHQRVSHHDMAVRWGLGLVVALAAYLASGSSPVVLVFSSALVMLWASVTPWEPLTAPARAWVRERLGPQPMAMVRRLRVITRTPEQRRGAA